MSLYFLYVTCRPSSYGVPGRGFYCEQVGHKRSQKSYYLWEGGSLWMQKPFFYTIVVGIWESILPWRFGHGQCKPKGAMDKSYQLCNRKVPSTLEVFV